MAARMLDARDQEQRIARAVNQSGDYTFRPHGNAFLCEGPNGAYIVSRERCDCRDWVHRCSRSGAVCKHVYMLTSKLLAEG